MVHSHHFLPFFRCERTVIVGRLEWFEGKLKEVLPEVWGHLAGMQVSVDLFLIEWMSTLLSTSLPFPVTLRVWDNFLIEGEE